MRTDNVVRIEAMDALIASLGAVDAERFISMVKRDTFDYTDGNVVYGMTRVLRKFMRWQQSMKKIELLCTYK